MSDLAWLALAIGLPWLLLALAVCLFVGRSAELRDELSARPDDSRREP